MESKSFKHPEVNLNTLVPDDGDKDEKSTQQHHIGLHTNTPDDQAHEHPENGLPDGRGINIEETTYPHKSKLQAADHTADKSPTIFDPEIVNRMEKIIANYTENHEELKSITSETNINFIERLNIDSVDVVEIIIDTEQEFGITIEDEEIKQLKTFELLYKLVTSKIQAAQENGE